jgi:hypothetical protein
MPNHVDRKITGGEQTTLHTTVTPNLVCSRIEDFGKEAIDDIQLVLSCWEQSQKRATMNCD